MNVIFQRFRRFNLTHFSPDEKYYIYFREIKSLSFMKDRILKTDAYAVKVTLLYELCKRDSRRIYFKKSKYRRFSVKASKFFHYQNSSQNK